VRLPEKLRKTEFWVALAGIAGAVATAVLESGLLPAASVVAVVLGIVVIAATYIAGRSWEKAARAGRRPNVVFSPEDNSLARSIRTRPPPPAE